MLSSDGSLTVSSSGQAALTLTQPGSGNLFLAFLNAKAISSNGHWAMGVYDNEERLSFSRRTSG
eukprot:9636701-Heterocapsa_arctica.AAC.1